MNESDIQKIEQALHKQLPSLYRKSLVEYPFPKDSFADEFMLPNDPNLVIEQNAMLPHADNIIAVGSDGGEQIYFLQLNEDEDTGVSIYDLENPSKKMKLTSSWDAYLKHIQNTLNEIAEDEKHMNEKNAHKKWWQFWI